MAICCVLYFSMTPNFEIIRCCVYKILKVTSSDLGNQCFETCSWTPLTMVKSLLSNSALLEIRIPALAFNCSYASSAINKILNTLTVYGIRLHLRIQLTFCEIHLQLRNPKQLAIFACCRIRDTQNVPTKFTLHSYVRGIHGSFVSGFHLHFGTCLRISFWNPGIYRHKTMRLSSAQFGLVMLFMEKCLSYNFIVWKNAYHTISKCKKKF